MASTQTGMKRKAEEDMERPESSKSARLGGLDDQEPNKDETNNETERQEQQDAPDDDFNEEEYLHLQAKERETANKFLQHMILLIETRRRDISKTNTTAFSERQKIYLKKLCEMATEESLHRNSYLEMSFTALTDLERLATSMQRTEAQEAEVLKRVQEWEGVVDARTRVRLPKTVDDGEVVAGEEELEERAAEAEKALEEAEIQLSYERAEDEGIFETVGLVMEAKARKMGLIRDVEVKKRGEGDEGERPQGPELDQPNLNDPQPAQEAGSHGQQPTPAPPPREMLKYVQEKKQDALRKAEAELNDMIHQRERARRHYDQELYRYLQAQKNKNVGGTKSDFDRAFFMDQVNFTAEQKEAEGRVERAKKQMRAVGKGSEKLEEDVSDLSGGDAVAKGEFKRSLIWEMREQEILERSHMEADRLFDRRIVYDDGTTKTLVGEDDWSITSSRPESGGLSAHAFSDRVQPCVDDLFGGERRENIDEYQKQQERLRRKMQLGDLFWWQECCGIWVMREGRER